MSRRALRTATQTSQRLYPPTIFSSSVRVYAARSHRPPRLTELHPRVDRGIRLGERDLARRLLLLSPPSQWSRARCGPSAPATKRHVTDIAPERSTRPRRISVTVALLAVVTLMHGVLGRPDAKAKFRQMFSNNRAVKVLAAARIFLSPRAMSGSSSASRLFPRRPALELLARRRLPRRLDHRLRHRAGPGAAAAAPGRSRRRDGHLAGLRPRRALYQWQGLQACLWASAAFVLAAGALSRTLPGTGPWLRT
jgi:hypothetical protein